MTTESQKKVNQFKIDEVTKDFHHQDNEINGTIDRARMSWILNLILNQKSRQEIVKDITDGILSFKDIEKIFPANYVEELRQCTPEIAQNYINRFKSMTDGRMKKLLTLMLSRKSREERIQLMNDHAASLDDVQKSYLLNYEKLNEKAPSSSSKKKSSSKGPANIDVKNSEEPRDVGTKKKRNATKKGEKETDTKRREIEDENLAKKVRVVKLKNDKRVGDVNGGNKVVGAIKEISRLEENRFSETSGQCTWSDLGESLMQTRQDGFEESSLETQGDRSACNESLGARCDTKKTANSKNLARGDAKLVGAKRASKKVGKDARPPSTRNKGRGEVKNPVASSTSMSLSSSSRNDDYNEEKEKSRSLENELENEVRASFVTSHNYPAEIGNDVENFADSLPKTRPNQDANIPNISVLTSGEQDVRENVRNQLGNVQEYNYNIQLGTSTPKKFNCEGKFNRIKEEPLSESSLNEFDYLVGDKDKILNTSQNSHQKKDSREELSTKRGKTIQNSKAKPSKKTAAISKKVVEPSKFAKPEKDTGHWKKENKEKKSSNISKKRGSTDAVKLPQQRKLDRKERKREERMRKREKKMQRAMIDFSDQVARLVRDIGKLDVNEHDECSCSCSSEESSSYDSSSYESSSYDSSSGSCSCSCSDCYSSDDYSEYTLCSCSECYESSSDTKSDYSNEE